MREQVKAFTVGITDCLKVVRRLRRRRFRPTKFLCHRMDPISCATFMLVVGGVFPEEGIWCTLQEVRPAVVWHGSKVVAY